MVDRLTYEYESHMSLARPPVKAKANSKSSSNLFISLLYAIGTSLRGRLGTSRSSMQSDSRVDP